MHAAAMSSAVSAPAASYAGASPARRARRRGASVFLASDSDISRRGGIESIPPGRSARTRALVERARARLRRVTHRRPSRRDARTLETAADGNPSIRATTIVFSGPSERSVAIVSIVASFAYARALL